MGSRLISSPPTLSYLYHILLPSLLFLVYTPLLPIYTCNFPTMADQKDYSIPTQALITYTDTDWRLQPVLVRPPGPHELLIQIAACGICHTDIANVGGIYPRILGHEGAGHILRCGEAVAPDLQQGDPVLLSFAHCRACRACTTGHPAHCHEQVPLTIQGRDLNFALAASEPDDPRLAPDPSTGKHRLIPASYFGHSSFAATALVKESSVVPVKHLINSPSELPLFAPLGCGIQTGACAVVNIAQPTKPDANIAVFGLGGVGLSAVMAAKALDVKTIIAVDVLPNRLQLAAELGATHTINSRDHAPDGLARAIRALPPFAMSAGPEAPLGPSAIVDTTGIPALLQAALAAVDRFGKVVQLANQGPGSFVSVGLPEHMSAGVSLTG